MSSKSKILNYSCVVYHWYEPHLKQVAYFWSFLFLHISPCAGIKAHPGAAFIVRWSLGSNHIVRNSGNDNYSLVELQRLTIDYSLQDFYNK